MDPSETPQDSGYIFLDTCVLQAAASSEKAKSEKVLDCLKELTHQKYRLAISEFTFYENLHGLWGEKAQKAVTLLHSYEKKVVSDKVLIVASFLGGLYVDVKSDGPNAGDKIIAATAILENGFVLTENHRDFPHPFFLTEKSITLTYTKAGRYKKTIDLALYKPNVDLIGRRIQEKDQ